MNIRFIAYSVILIILGAYIINAPQIYYVWGFVSIACAPFFAGLGISQGLEEGKSKKIFQWGGIGLTVLLLLIILALYGKDLSYILR